MVIRECGRGLLLDSLGFVWLTNPPPGPPGPLPRGGGANLEREDLSRGHAGLADQGELAGLGGLFGDAEDGTEGGEGVGASGEKIDLEGGFGSGEHGWSPDE